MSLAANDPRPKSVQAADELRGRITAGRYSDGRLPPSRRLAEDFGIAGETLNKALRMLVAEGLIFSAGNRGYFIATDEEDASDAKPDVVEDIKELRSQIQALAERVAHLEERAASGRA
ncbi:winged helix-turn-helix domain-containing protein [Streptomyces sp.]|uniref:winged helix-turn-helix domain-containing protein n=1 Tax=Streptomyces sp. TaxID=1931 RepID=UPI002D77DCC6|nr:winged helix-turn-helix domain-containing protein [Streptomyces sp.]HET6358482.1 winged helix-turn-helix domain-containing protein [Streptomyces sp.]